MTAEGDEIIYRAIPLHLIQYEDGAIIKRGTLETHIRGERALEILQRILERAAKGTTLKEIRMDFRPEERLAIDHILHQLIERRLLVPADIMPEFDRKWETPESIFYWEFGQDTEWVHSRLREVSIAIIGVNEIARELVRCLSHSGFENYLIVDYERLRNMRFYHGDGVLDMDRWSEVEPVPLSEWESMVQHIGVGCLVATTDHGGLHWMREWNERCVAKGEHFFPVALHNLIGYIGPYVIPGETACFECLRARQNSNLSSPDKQRATEMVAFESQEVIGFHPLMPRAVAQIAAIELIKFFSGVLPFMRVGTLIEVDLLTPGLVTRKVLRIPSCPVCGRLRKYAPVSVSPIENIMPS